LDGKNAVVTSYYLRVVPCVNSFGKHS